MTHPNANLDEEMLPDDLKDFLSKAKDIQTFLLRMGKIWKRCRIHHYQALPISLVFHLDEIAGLMRCDEPGCLALVHRTWDFCYIHGRAK